MEQLRTSRILSLMERYKNVRAANAASGVGRNGGKRQLAHGNFSPKVGGEARGSNAAATGADGEEVEIVLSRRLGAVGGLGPNCCGEVAARMRGRNGIEELSGG